MKKKYDWRKWVRRTPVIAALTALGLNLYFFITRAIDMSAFAGILVALGTGLLAWQTWELGQTTIRENRKIREDSERIRNEERRDEALRRIREWAQNNIRVLLVSFPTWARLSSKERKEAMYPTFQMIRADSIGIRLDATKIGANVPGLVHDAFWKILRLEAQLDGLEELSSQTLTDAVTSLEEILKNVA